MVGLGHGLMLFFPSFPSHPKFSIRRPLLRSWINRITPGSVLTMMSQRRCCSHFLSVKKRWITWATANHSTNFAKILANQQIHAGGSSLLNSWVSCKNELDLGLACIFMRCRACMYVLSTHMIHLGFLANFSLNFSYCSSDSLLLQAHNR